jgi:MFS family permease
VPFWLSAFMVVVGYAIRRRLDETPEFEAERVDDELPHAPVGELLRDHWAAVLRVFVAAFIAMVNTTFAVFALSFATSDTYGAKISSTAMLWLAIVANVVAICVIPVWAALSDRVGRKPVFVTGVLGSAVLVSAFLWAISIGSTVLVFVFGIALAGVVYSMPNAVWPATYAEYFPTRVRISGMAVGTQFGFALAGFTPTISGALLGSDAGNWYKVAIFAVAACLVAAVAVLTGPSDTHRLATPEVGLRRRTAKKVAEATAA